MREIKFRGVSKITGNYIIGDLITPNYDGQDYHIQVYGNFGATPVHRDSIGQYTGLLDKNEVEIYEGDIVKLTDEMEEEYIADITYQSEDGYPAFDVSNSDLQMDSESHVLSMYLSTPDFSVEVIGNVYENKELLK